VVGRKAETAARLSTLNSDKTLRQALGYRTLLLLLLLLLLLRRRVQPDVICTAVEMQGTAGN
jgi:hypothetical protein